MYNYLKRDDHLADYYFYRFQVGHSPGVLVRSLLSTCCLMWTMAVLVSLQLRLILGTSKIPNLSPQTEYSASHTTKTPPISLVSSRRDFLAVHTFQSALCTPLLLCQWHRKFIPLDYLPWLL
jgi:hypothetical protein